jgi:predicted nucleic acid-binding protein
MIRRYHLLEPFRLSLSVRTPDSTRTGSFLQVGSCPTLTYLDRVRAIFTLVDAGTIQVTASAITLTEVLVLPFQTGNTTYVNEYRDMLLNSENISTIPVSVPIAEKAATLRATYRLRTPDAFHIATAIMAGCDAFLTNDLGLKRVTEIKIIVLDELTLDPETQDES